MKTTLICVCCVFLATVLCAQGTETIVLNPPDMSRGSPLMKALSLRASAEEFDTTNLKLQDLSDVLWAANGINRPAVGKRTAPSAMNAQDVDVYVLLKSGVYLYHAQKHTLEPAVAGDYRPLCSGRRIDEPLPPVICLLVSDISRFKFGTDSLRLVWAAMDAGIVSQNISIFCSSIGLATRPRAGMNREKLREVLKLTDAQRLMLNHPISYMKD